MRKDGLRVVFLSGVLLLLAGCGHLVYADGPYRGRVLDAETKQPIEGAAVLAVWWKRSPVIVHPVITFYDAQETLTDQSGNFTIPGIFGGSLNPLAVIEEPLFTIFKPGYEAYGDRKLPLPGKERRAVVELRHLTTREDRMRNLREVYVPSDVPEEKYRNLIKLRNIERVNLGLSPTHIRKEGQQ